MSVQPGLVIVGGFLGAGKTSLLLAAAARLRSAGKRVGVITNDQGGELVDTRLFQSAGFETREIAGGCFCCRFSELAKSAEALCSSAPEVIFAEPVGSCTDLVAAVLRPLGKFYGNRFRLAPLTVLVEPQRAGWLLGPDADPDLAYLFRKQLAEADLVLISKSDQGDALPNLDGAGARPVSALTGEGVSEWLEEVLGGGIEAGARILELDYGRYAAAEARLGWLNWRASITLQRALTPAAVVGPFLERLDRRLTAAGAKIAHLKVFAQTAGGYLKASICRNGEEPSVDGALDAPPAMRHELVVNLRAAAAPEALEAALDDAVEVLPGRLRVRHRECFLPKAPMKPAARSR